MTQTSSTINVSDDGFAKTVEIVGAFTGAEEHAFKDAMADVASDEAGVILDLRNCQRCDTRAAFLMLRYKRALAGHLQIIVAKSGRVQRFLEMSGLLQPLAVTTNGDRARDRLLRALYTSPA